MAKQKASPTEYRNYFLPMNFPVLLLAGDHWRISDVPSGRLHFHNCLEIGICHSDGGTMEFFGNPVHFQAGDVTVVPRNVPHTTYSDPGKESLWSYIYLSPRDLFRGLLPSSWQNYDLSVYSFKGYKYILNREDYPNVHHLATQVARELQELRPSYQLSAKGLLLSLYIELYRIESMAEDGQDNGSHSPKRDEERSPERMLTIAPVLDYIEDNYMQQFTMEDLSQLCHLSSTHFRRVFHEIMGTSPLDYVNNTRIMKACGLLRSTEASVLDISEMVGFRSVSSFNRCFSRIMQMPPREYRRQMQQADSRTSNLPALEYAGWLFPE